MGAHKNTITMARLTAVLGSWPGEETLPKSTTELREILAGHLKLNTTNIYVSGGEINTKGINIYSFKVEVSKCDEYVTLGFFEIYSMESSEEGVHIYWTDKVPKWLKNR